MKPLYIPMIARIIANTYNSVTKAMNMLNFRSEVGVVVLVVAGNSVFGLIFCEVESVMMYSLTVVESLV